MNEALRLYTTIYPIRGWYMNGKIQYPTIHEIKYVTQRKTNQPKTQSYHLSWSSFVNKCLKFIIFPKVTIQATILKIMLHEEDQYSDILDSWIV